MQKNKIKTKYIVYLVMVAAVCIFGSRIPGFFTVKNILKWHFLDNIEFEKQHAMDTQYSITMYNKCLKLIRKIDASTQETE